MANLLMGDLIITTEPLPSLDILERWWRTLDRTGNHSFFLTWTWMGAWLRALPPTVVPVLAKAMDGENLAGLAVLVFKRASLRRIASVRQAWLNAAGDPALDCITIEHNGFARVDPRGNDLVRALISMFADGKIAVDEIVLPGMAEGRCDETQFIEAGHVSAGFCAPLTGLDGEAGIEPLLSRNARQQLRRSMRAFERKGALRLEFARDSKTALEYFEGFKALHVRWWEPRGRRHAFANPFFETFHRVLIANAACGDDVDLIRVSAGDHVIGYLYNFRRHDTVYSYQSGFDNSDPGARPGYVCHALAMAHYARAGLLRYDFLAGHNRLKRTLGTEHYDLSWRRLRKKTLLFRAERLILELRERASAKQFLPPRNVFCSFRRPIRSGNAVQSRP